MPQIIDQSRAFDLLQGLVAIPSVSRQEQEASSWLVEEMRSLGYDRAYVDAAGNAVGEIGSRGAEAVFVLLGHIDTVQGDIPVRIVNDDAGERILYGRGSVDAKGPLATLTVATAKLADALTENDKIRIVVVGAVEEEAATSKGARFVCSRFNGETEPLPSACIIGEPSSWRRITLGYKGRLLCELEAAQAMAHTAGPDAGVATIAVHLWNQVEAYSAKFNQDKEKLFDQLMPSLRHVNTGTDEAMMDKVRMQIGIRLPLDFDADGLSRQIGVWLADRIEAEPSRGDEVKSSSDIRLTGTKATARLRFHGHERAWRGDRNNSLVRSFLAAIRAVDPGVRPALVSKTGTSDMNVVGPIWQCPIVAFGPGDSALDHTPHEHIHLQEYWQAILVLEEALHKLTASFS